MSEAGDPFAAFGSDRTIIKPSAGRGGGAGVTAAPPAPAGAAAPAGREVPLSLDTMMSGSLNPLVNAAMPLLAAAPRVRQTARHPNPAALRDALAEGIRKFEAQARSQGLPNEQVVAGFLSKEQARSHPLKNVVTRALGGESEVVVDVREIEVKPGDLYLLCSDGLTGMLSDADIRERLSSGRDLHEICRSLVNDSNARGGIDNVTVVLLKIEEEEDGEDTQGTRV